MSQQALPFPNPGDWTDANGAAAILGVDRATVTRMIQRGTLHAYEIGSGSVRILWAPDVRELAAARALTARRNGLASAAPVALARPAAAPEPATPPAPSPKCDLCDWRYTGPANYVNSAMTAHRRARHA
jgi:excisionase family DNA binding protein